MHTRLYPGPYAARAAADHLEARVAALKERHGLVDQRNPIEQPAQLKMAFSS